MILSVWTAATPNRADSTTSASPQSVRTANIDLTLPSAALADDAFDVMVRSAGGVRFVRVSVFARSSGSAAFTGFPARRSGDGFVALLPSAVVQPPFVELYVRAELPGGRVVTLPEAAADTHPLRIAVAPNDPGILVLTPEEDEVDVEPRPQIAAVFDPPLDDADRASLSVDGRALTGSSARDYISAVPDRDLEPGEHVARVTVVHDGDTRQRRWTFTLGARNGETRADRFDLAGRVSLGVQSAGGASLTPIARAYVQELPGDYVIADADVSTRHGHTDVTAWLTSSPGFSPRTTGAILSVSPRVTWEAGAITPLLSDIALSGSTAWGARVSSGPAHRSVDAYALFASRDSLLQRYGTSIAAASASMGRAGAYVTLLGVYASESGTPFDNISTRHGWTVAPGVAIGDARTQARAHVAFSRATPTTGSPAPTTTRTLTASFAEFTGSRPIVRWSLRGTHVPIGYAALGAPYAQSGRTDALATTTVGRSAGLSATGTYRLSRVDSTFITPITWFHQSDAAVSWYSARGSGATLTLGRVDRTNYVGSRGTWATPRTRLSADVTRNSSETSTIWAGSAAGRRVIGPRLSVDANAVFSSVLPRAPGSMRTGDFTPTVTMTWSPSAHTSLEIGYSSSHKTFALVSEDGSTQNRSIQQTTVRASLARRF